MQPPTTTSCWRPPSRRESSGECDDHPLWLRPASGPTGHQPIRHEGRGAAEDGEPALSHHTTGFRKAPKGKLPYILDEGRPIGDSTLIIEHLKATRGIDPDESLGPPERAQALALQRLVEEHLYFAVVYSRWVDEEGWPLFADAVFGRLRQPLRRAGEFWYREHVRKMLHLQGLGRHSRDEIYALARADLEAMAELLGDKPFFMGDRITTVDAVAYGCLANILLVPLETELKRIAAGLPSLGAWCEAMEQGLRSDSEGSGSP